MERYLPVKRLFLQALALAAGCALLHKIGYRGKNNPGTSPSSWEDTAVFFGGAFVFMFLVGAVLWPIAAWLGRNRQKEEPIQPPETTRGK
jgi:hypothetical protein